MLNRLGVERRERWLFSWSAAALFFVGWADVSLKNVAETFFLKRVGVEQLPLVFLANSLLLVATTWAVGRIVSRVGDRVRLLPRVLIALAMLLLLLSLAVVVGLPGVLSLLVIVSKQISALALLVFFIALGELLDGRQAKRLFAPLAGGVTLGIIAGSFASEPLGRLFGIAALLPVAALALATAAACTLPLQWRRPRALQPYTGAPEVEVEAGPDLRELWRDSQLFRLLCVSALCGGLLGPMLYFQFSYVADLATQGIGAERQLLVFYARFRGWIHVAVLVGQLGVAARLYRWIGLPLAAAISPLFYLLGFAGLSVRLSLPAGVAAMSLTKAQDNAVFDSAVRVLVDLFPDSQRARAMALLEGPIKRGGGALGNLVVLAALALGGAVWVGWIALPISAAWLVVALALWRSYPSLLLGTTGSARGRSPDDVSVEMLDANTLRKLARHLRDPDLDRCKTAVDLVCEAPVRLSAGVLAAAAREAPAANRPLLVASLDRVLERAPASTPADFRAAEDIAELLSDPSALDERSRADAVQAVGRLAPAADEAAIADVLETALRDPSAAVRLAAAAAKSRGAEGVTAELLDSFASAARSDDPVLRRTAREELRAQLLRVPKQDSELPLSPLELLVELLEREGEERAEAAQALADVASLHGPKAAVVAEAVLAQRGDTDPRVRAAVLRFAGYAGLSEQAAWLVTHVAEEGEGSSLVRSAARDALRALGAKATQPMIAELSFGHRRMRDAVLPLLRELRIEPAALDTAYRGELESLRGKFVQYAGLAGEEVADVVLKRIHERIDEGLFTLLHLLAARHGDDRIAAVADGLRRAHGAHRHAALTEVLEALLPPGERAELLPLLKDPSEAIRGKLGADPTRSSENDALNALLGDPDELTRYLARVTMRGVDAGTLLPDHPDVPNHVERALLLPALPTFEGLTTRQLVHVAERTREEVHPPGATIVREGDAASCLIVIEGDACIYRGSSIISQLGAGDFFGDVAVFDAKRGSPTRVTTKDGARILSLSRESLWALMDEVPGIAIRICESLSRQLLDKGT